MSNHINYNIVKLYIIQIWHYIYMFGLNINIPKKYVLLTLLALQINLAFDVNLHSIYYSVVKSGNKLSDSV